MKKVRKQKNGQKTGINISQEYIQMHNKYIKKY